MTSQDGIEANRINAKRSTGPRTPSGKARSSLNARKHGLSGKTIVIGDEDPKEFDALRAALEHDLQPSTELESELVDRLAGQLWRLRRVPAIEAAIVKSRQEEAYDEVYSKVEAEKFKEIEDEARGRCKESFGYDPIKIQTAMGSGLWDAKFAKIWEQVRDEEQSKKDIYACISEEADKRYENSRESELVLLMRAKENGDLIDRLSRYEASLMNAVNKTLQQMWLVRGMKDGSQVITPTTATRRARLASSKVDRKGSLGQASA
jgi:hypothetical protein